MIKFSNISSNLLFRVRLLLIAAFSVGYVLFLIYISSVKLINNQEHNSQRSVQLSQKTALVARIFSELDKIISIEKQELNIAFSAESNAKFKPRRINYAILEQELASLKTHMEGNEEQQLFTNLRKLTNDHKSLHLRINTLIFKGDLKKAAQLDLYQLEKTRKELRRKLLSVIGSAEQQSFVNVSEAKAMAMNNMLQVGIASALYLGLVIFILISIIKDLRSTTVDTTSYLAELNLGIVPVKDLSVNYTEVGQINQLINNVGNYQRRVRKNINSLLQKEEDTFQLASENDKIGQLLVSLKEMHTNILEEKEKKQNAYAYSEWVFSGIKRFNDILTKLAPNIETLADNIVRELVDYLNLPLAGFYAMNSRGNHNYLELVATYAFDKKKLYSKSVEIGEGLVGAAVIEKHMSFHSNIPEDYFQITSGMGSSRPTKLLIIPLLHNQEVVGVIELAAFSNFEQKHVDFLEQVTPNMAVTVSTVEANERNFLLMNQNENYIEQLQTDKKTLEEELNSLKVEVNDLENSVEDLNRITTAINAHTIVVELTSKGEILSFSEKFVELSKFPASSLKKSKFHKFIKNVDEVNLFKDGKPTQNKGLQRIVLTNQALDTIPVLGSLTWSTVYHNRVFFIGFEFAEFDSNLQATHQASLKLKEEHDIFLKELQLLRAEKEVNQSIESTQKQLVAAIDPIIAYAKFDLNWNLVEHNDSFLKECSLRHQEARKINLGEIIPEDFFSRISLLESSFNKGQLHRSVVPITWQGSEQEVWFELEIIPIIELDRVRKFMFVRFKNLDETHRKELLLEGRRQRIMSLEVKEKELTDKLTETIQNSISKEQGKQMQEQFVEMKKESDLLKEEMGALKAQNLFYKEDKNALKKQLKTNQIKLESQLEEIVELSNKLEQKNTQIASSAQGETQLRESLSELQVANQKLNLQLAETHSEMERYKEDRSNDNNPQAAQNIQNWMSDLKKFIE